MTHHHINFASELGHTALKALARICRDELKAATDEQLEAACAAMRERARPALDRLMEDVKEAPWIAQMAFANAALDIAQAGAEVLRKEETV